MPEYERPVIDYVAGNEGIAAELPDERTFVPDLQFFKRSESSTIHDLSTPVEPGQCRISVPGVAAEQVIANPHNSVQTI